MTEDRRILKRKLSNLLLKPLLQTKIGLYFIAITILVALSLAAAIYYHFADLFIAILDLTDAGDEVKDLLNVYWSSIQIWIYGLLAVYVSTTILISIWYTHRFVGPAVAFHKHLVAIANGDYTYRTNLRRHDAFEELADALNLASEGLEHLKWQEPAILEKVQKAENKDQSP